MPIKFLDLAAQNEEIRRRVDAEYERMHSQTAYVGGPQVAEFEARFADYLGAGSLVGVGSGTDALRLALLAAGIGPGDEVITTPLTFVATAAAIRQAGARAVLVDVEPDTCNLSPRALRRYLEERRDAGAHLPRAVMP